MSDQAAIGFTIEYIDLIQEAANEFDRRELYLAEDITSAKKLLNDLKSNIDDMTKNREKDLAYSLAKEDVGSNLRAVHFGYIEPGESLSILNNGSIYFDQFVFQEYLSRSLVRETIDLSTLTHFREVFNELIALRQAVSAGMAIIMPNKGFKAYAKTPPKPLFPSLIKVAPYLFPTIHLSVAIGAIPFTTWEELDGIIFSDFKGELLQSFNLHPAIAKESWLSTVCVDVFREFSEQTIEMPFLKKAEFSEILEMRNAFAGFRDSLKTFAQTPLPEGYEKDIRSAIVEVNERLLECVKEFKKERKKRKSNAFVKYCIGGLLTLLGLSSFNFLTILAATGSFSIATNDLVKPQSFCK